jgi:hypothetical protein
LRDSVLKNSHVLSITVAFLIVLASLIFVTEGDTENTVLVTVFDESGFPPAGSSGAEKLSQVPVNVTMLDGSIVASGITDNTGSLQLTLSLGTYDFEFGGVFAGVVGTSYKMPIGKRTTRATIDGTNTVELYAFAVTYHNYSAGGPYELNYVDLNRDTSDHETVVRVKPGQQVNAEFSWWELETVNVPVWYVSIFGSWSATSALERLGSGVASPSSHNLNTLPLSFMAPETPGTYEVRLVGVLDYDWPNSFYTADHYQPSQGRDTGISVISKEIDGPYGIGTIIVRAPMPQNAPPSASFYVSPTTAKSGQQVQFYDTSTDTDGIIVSWYWEFGDGSTSVSQDPSHTYSNAGTYTIRLEVTDNNGTTNIIAKTMDIVAEPVQLWVYRLFAVAIGTSIAGIAIGIGLSKRSQQPRLGGPGLSRLHAGLVMGSSFSHVFRRLCWEWAWPNGSLLFLHS